MKLTDIPTVLFEKGFAPSPMSKHSIVRGEHIVRLCFTCNTFTHVKGEVTNKIVKANDESEEVFIKKVTQYIDEYIGA